MMTIKLWLAFVAASAAWLTIPGPTVLLMLSYALSQGRCVALGWAPERPWKMPSR